MSEPTTVEEFVNRVERSWKAWLDTVACVTRERAAESGFHKDWTLTDVIAHVTWYEKQMIGLLEAQRFVGSELWELPTDERNEIIREENAGRDHTEVLADAKNTHARMIGLLSQLGDEQLNDPAAFPGMPPDWTPALVFEGNMHEHYDGHAELVREYLARRRES